VCRTLLLHLYTAKLALQPKHSKQGAIFYHTSCYRYGLTHTTVPKPVGALPARPLQRLGIKLPDQIPTNSILTYHMPYVRSLARQTHKSSDICPYVLLACRGGTLHTSGPYSYVQWWTVCLGTYRQCFHVWWPRIFISPTKLNSFFHCRATACCVQSSYVHPASILSV
jgi:hypothetical protein